MAYKRNDSRRAIGKVGKKAQNRLPISDHKEKAQNASLIHGYLFSKKGTIKNLRVDIEELKGENGSLLLEIERVRANTTLRKVIKVKAGANNLGNFDVDAGDRLRITLNSNGAIQAHGVWVTYDYVK